MDKIYNKTILELMIFSIGTELLNDEEMIAIEEHSLEKIRICEYDNERGINEESMELGSY